MRSIQLSKAQGVAGAGGDPPGAGAGSGAGVAGPHCSTLLLCSTVTLDRGRCTHCTLDSWTVKYSSHSRAVRIGRNYRWLWLVGTIGGSDWLVHWEEDGQENGSICQIASFFAAACSTKLLQLVTSHEWKLLQRNYSNISSKTCSKVSFVPSCFFVLRRLYGTWQFLAQNGPKWTSTYSCSSCHPRGGYKSTASQSFI